MRRQLMAATIVVAALLLGAPVTPATAGPASACPLSVAPRDPGWVSIEGPDFEQAGIPMVGTFGAETLAVSPSEPNVMLIGTGNQVFRTSDSGCTWKKVFATPDSPFLDCKRIPDAVPFFDPCGHIYDLDIGSDGHAFIEVRTATVWNTVAETYIFASADEGNTWGALTSIPPGMAGGTGPLAISPSQPKTIYVERGNGGSSAQRDCEGCSILHGLYVSHDGGASWTEQLGSGDFPNSYLIPESLYVSEDDPDHVWTAGAFRSPEKNATAQHFAPAVSKDGGKTWALVRTPLTDSGGSTNFAIYEAAGKPVRIATLDNHQAIVSTDGGKSWIPAAADSPGDRLARLAFGKGGRSLFAVWWNYSVARFDINKMMAYAIKMRSYSDDPALDAQGSWMDPQYVPGSGLYLLGNCHADQFTCYDVYRYSGRGT
ncbi:MAG TPA: hypothetical protein VFK89_00315 [Actinomycetota bacterium]|nr:hypothetical protein [Actinomycetota bacterium]